MSQGVNCLIACLIIQVLKLQKTQAYRIYLRSGKIREASISMKTLCSIKIVSEAERARSREYVSIY